MGTFWKCVLVKFVLTKFVLIKDLVYLLRYRRHARVYTTKGNWRAQNMFFQFTKTRFECWMMNYCSLATTIFYNIYLLLSGHGGNGSCHWLILHRWSIIVFFDKLLFAQKLSDGLFLVFFSQYEGRTFLKVAWSQKNLPNHCPE